MVSYDYDAWGNLISVTGTLADTVGQMNPLRYRGYYYDAETGFYYLQSRYYDPVTQRFINADALLDQSTILGYNLFAYCGNNPVKFFDPTGNFGIAITAAAATKLLLFAITVVVAVALTDPNVQNGIKEGAREAYESSVDAAKSVYGTKSKEEKSAVSVPILRSIQKAAARVQAKIQREKHRYDYWIAVYVDYGEGNGTYIPIIPISFSRATSYVRGGGNVFADSRNNAYKLVRAVGGGPPMLHPAHGGVGYWKHYHATQSGKKIGGHVFYVS